MPKDNMSYLFVCDECEWSTFVDTSTDETYPHLCNGCYEAFRRKGDNWKDWEEVKWSIKQEEQE